MDAQGDSVPWTAASLVGAFDELHRDVDARSIDNWRSGRFLPSRRNRIILARIASRGAPRHRQLWQDAFLAAPRAKAEPQDGDRTDKPDLASELPDLAQPPIYRRRGPVVAMLATFVLIVASGLYAYGPGLLWEDTSPVRIAVLDFTAEDAEIDSQALSSGLRDAVHNALVQIDSYEVVASRTVRAAEALHGGSGAPSMDVADELEADYLIGGELFYVDGAPRLRIDLIDTMNEVSLQAWSDVYGEERDQLLSVDLDVANDISEVVNVKLFRAGSARMRSTGTDNLSAYLDYLRARQRLKYWHEDRSAYDIELAAREFLSASAHDPDWHLPLFHIGDIYYHMAAGHVPVSSAPDLPQSREGALLALRETLNRSARLADEEGARMQNLLNRIYFSDDWQDMDEIGRAYVDNSVRARGELEWLFEPVALLHLGDVGLVDRLVDDRVLMYDPENGTAHAYSVRARLLERDLPAAKARLSRARATSFSNRLDEVAGYIHVTEGAQDDLARHLQTTVHLTPVMRDYFAAILTAWTDGTDAALSRIEASAPLAADDVQRAFALAHIGANKRADSLFAQIQADAGGPALIQTALAYGAGCGSDDWPALAPLLEQRRAAGLPPMGCMTAP